MSDAAGGDSRCAFGPVLVQLAEGGAQLGDYLPVDGVNWRAVRPDVRDAAGLLIFAEVWRPHTRCAAC